MVCHIGGQLGTKVVISALGILALYMRFNGTGIWGGETLSIRIKIVRTFEYLHIHRRYHGCRCYDVTIII